MAPGILESRFCQSHACTISSTGRHMRQHGTILRYLLGMSWQSVFVNSPLMGLGCIYIRTREPALTGGSYSLIAIIMLLWHKIYFQVALLTPTDWGQMVACYVGAAAASQSLIPGGGHWLCWTQRGMTNLRYSVSILDAWTKCIIVGKLWIKQLKQLQMQAFTFSCLCLW